MTSVPKTLLKNVAIQPLHAGAQSTIDHDDENTSSIARLNPVFFSHFCSEHFYSKPQNFFDKQTNTRMNVFNECSTQSR